LSLLENPKEGEIKFWLTRKLLDYRRTHSEIFTSGEYVPAEIGGKRKRNAIAFIRAWKGKRVLVIAPRFFHDLVTGSELPVGEACWGETFVELPKRFGKASKLRDVLLGAQLSCEGGRVDVARAFRTLPFAVLELV
jgi:maltooligosyltrehalose synthase